MRDIKIIGDNIQKEILNKKNKFIVIGEIHGAKENIDVARMFIKFLIKQEVSLVFAMEWPKDLNKEINGYINNANKLDWKLWPFSRSPDGRISKEHIKFINWLKKKHISLECFDNSGKNWNDRDKKMAVNIIDTQRKNKGKKILILMGNLHARKTSFVLDNKNYFPTASHFPKNNTVSFKINYLSGQYFNIHLKKIEQNKKIKKGNEKIRIIKSKNNMHDYEIILKKATPITILDKKK